MNPTTLQSPPTRRRPRLLRVAAAITVATGTAAAVPGPAAAAATIQQALTSPERVSYTTTSSAASRKTATVDCPGGKTVVGTGWTTNPSSPELLVEDLIPTEYSVTAVVREDETHTHPTGA